MSPFDAGALLLSAAGVIVAFSTAMVCRSIRAALPMTLEMWTAAGMLKLSGEPTWSTVSLVAIFVALRRILSFGIARA